MDVNLSCIIQGGASSENVGSLLRRSSSKDKERKLVRRSSSKKDKENGQKGSRGRSSSADVKTPASGDYMSSPRRRTPAPVPDSPPALTDHDCTETDVQRVHVSLTYKPRIWNQAKISIEEVFFMYQVSDRIL